MTKEQREAIEQTVDADLILDTIAENFTPEQVFGEDVLDQWAMDNNYKKSKHEE